ncbi:MULTISPECIES: DUF4271 domain-containing protein [unclassified Lentimicrobium]|uniref:DUF4271 domain-containing protein n=1 Tax=unclassified Lentimicrobium TaxID=2677434 RepID=UPI0015553E50|nr:MULTISPECIES: DUF4271 domain-containing protein [unclassified Lentimicrobium]NPD46664.1 DUF4271 domain-containing protein [Lentimicrobium sp. S6]NPD85489.1 DUF4271 domain-containing protein [Lentimicrobium sp. L6]
MKDSIAILTMSIEDSLAYSLDSVSQESISVFDTFEGQITPQNLNKAVEGSYSTDWLSLTFLGIVIYLIVVRFLFNFNFSEAFKGLFKIESLDQVSFEKLTQNTGYILTPISSIVYAYYVYFFINPNYLQLDLDYLFLVFAFIISVLFILKVFLEKIISLLFNSRKTFQSYFSDHLYMLGISGLFQLPFIVIFVYSQMVFFLWFSLAILLLFWLFRLLRGVIIGYNQSQFSKSYIFLYLCSLEILPILWACKWLINNQ